MSQKTYMTLEEDINPVLSYTSDKGLEEKLLNLHEPEEPSQANLTFDKSLKQKTLEKSSLGHTNTLRIHIPSLHLNTSTLYTNCFMVWNLSGIPSQTKQIIGIQSGPKYRTLPTS